MSMIFTPLLSADSGIDSTVHLQLHVIVADDVQAGDACHGVSAHRGGTLAAHPSLPALPGMDIPRTGQKGAPSRALYHLHRVLLRLLLLDGVPQHSPRHQHHRGSGTHHPDGMCPHQYMVEDQHPYSRHRRRGRRTGILFHRLLFQPAVVALLRADTGRSRRNGAHDTATALSLTGSYGIPRRSRLRHPGHLKPAPTWTPDSGAVQGT